MRVRLLTAAPELKFIRELDIMGLQSNPPFPAILIWESEAYRWRGRLFVNNTVIYSAVKSSEELKYVHNSN